MIWSVYRGQVESSAKTEEASHNGGALLHIEKGALRIYGTYFSDRGVKHHKPSSGNFDLWRFASDPDQEVSDEELADFLQRHPSS